MGDPIHHGGGDQVAGHAAFMIRMQRKTNGVVKVAVYSGSPAHEVVPLTFKSDLPSSAKPFWKYPHRQTQGHVSMETLSQPNDNND